MRDPTGRDIVPPFDVKDAQVAYDTWGCNCGPGALAGVIGVTLEQIRPWLGNFEQKRYTNPTLMTKILRGLGIQWTCGKSGWPNWGLARIQWHGPWMRPGGPIQARYRHTHWVGCLHLSDGSLGIFDINAINNGTGWVSSVDWNNVLVPYLLKDEPRADGEWSITHAINLIPQSVIDARLQIVSGMPTGGQGRKGF